MDSLTDDEWTVLGGSQLPSSEVDRLIAAKEKKRACFDHCAADTVLKWSHRKKLSLIHKK